MGITGLLPFLEKSSKRVNISQFSNKTVAIDSYCWLHKGVFTCAEKLSMGQPTDAYVRYCMKLINMLLEHNIKPILVFDGRHLPAKAGTEAKRRESRETNRRRAAELMRMGQTAEGRNLLRRSVDVTHEIALELIKQCQNLNIDCIVAPYEADAQLAYLNISGIADLVITEDSDLILFGCDKVFFKMDMNGSGLLVEQERLYLAMGLHADHFDMEKFRYMCILSGCDYLPSLPGIGLHKAKKFIKVNTDNDIHRAIARLGSYLNMKSLVVTQEYRDAFVQAVITFKHQLVFCPLQRRQIRLIPPSPDVTNEQLYHAGQEVDPDLAFQLALGNYDPFSLKALHNFDPDSAQIRNIKTNAWSAKPVHHKSIWSKDYKITSTQDITRNRTEDITRDKEQITLQTPQKRRSHRTTAILQDQHNPGLEELTGTDLLSTYEPGAKTPPNKTNSINMEEEKLSPVLIRRTNPFAIPGADNKVSPNLLHKKRRLGIRNLSRFKRTVIDENVIIKSKFFTEPLDVENRNENNAGVNVIFSQTGSSDNYEERQMESDANVANNVRCLKYLRIVNNTSSNENSENNTPVTEDELRKSDEMEVDTFKKEDKEIKPTAVMSNILESVNSNIEADLRNMESTEDIQSNLFKFGNTEEYTVTNDITTRKRSRSTNLHTVTSAASKSKHKTRQMSSSSQQQGLLSMYGFKKKNQIQC